MNKTLFLIPLILLAGCSANGQANKEEKGILVNEDNFTDYFDIQITTVNERDDKYVTTFSAQSIRTDLAYSEYESWCYGGSNLKLYIKVGFVLSKYNDEGVTDYTKSCYLVMGSRGDKEEGTFTYYDDKFAVTGWYVESFKAYAFPRSAIK